MVRSESTIAIAPWCHVKFIATCAFCRQHLEQAQNKFERAAWALIAHDWAQSSMRVSPVLEQDEGQAGHTQPSTSEPSAEVAAAGLLQKRITALQLWSNYWGPLCSAVKPQEVKDRLKNQWSVSYGWKCSTDLCMCCCGGAGMESWLASLLGSELHALTCM